MNLYDIIFVNCLKCWVINYKTCGVLLSLISFSVWLSFFGAERLACSQTMLETSLLLTMPCSQATKGYTPPLSTPFGGGKTGVGNTPSCSVAPTKRPSISSITSVEGPHSIEIISIIFGSLLGGGPFGQRIKNASEGRGGTRVVFFQEAMHVKYLL